MGRRHGLRRMVANRLVSVYPRATGRNYSAVSCLSKNGIGWRSPHLRFGAAMTKRRQWRGNLSAMRAEKRQAVDQYPAQRFPIQREIQRLEDELNAFNERIEELENEGHRSHAMEVLKANALDLARRIDELRCVLALQLI